MKDTTQDLNKIYNAMEARERKAMRDVIMMREDLRGLQVDMRAIKWVKTVKNWTCIGKSI